MKRAKSICREVACSATIPAPGYCEEHKKKEGERFARLEKAPGSRTFYGGSRWRRTASVYRQEFPLCAGHAIRGLVVKGDLVDHKIDRPVLEAQGLDPYDHGYLQTLCHSCHNKKLRERQSTFYKKG